MAAFPRRPDRTGLAVLGAIEALREAGRPVRVDTIGELTGRSRDSTSGAIARLRTAGRLPCAIERSLKRDAAYLKVVAAAEQIEREGGALSWDRIARVAGCTAKAAHGHSKNAERAGLWRFTVLPKYSLMTGEERRELWRSTRPNPTNNGWTSEEDVAPMDLAVLEEIRASKRAAARPVELKAHKFHTPTRRHH